MLLRAGSRHSSYAGCRCRNTQHPRLPARVSRVSAVRANALTKQVNKVVLAYSGGLDTSVILTWLKEVYDCEVVTFTADLGQVRAVSQVDVGAFDMML